MPIFHKSRFCVALLCGFFLLPLASVAEEIAVGRYVRVTTGLSDSQVNPLQTVVTINFPRGSVDTIGAAAEYLLQRSGYVLMSAEAANPHHVKLVGFPLPEVQREFELVTVMSALDALGGPSYEPDVNHEERIVSYKLRENEQHANTKKTKHRGKAFSQTPSLASVRPQSE